MKKFTLARIIFCISMLFVGCRSDDKKPVLSISFEKLENDSIEVLMAPFDENLPDEGVKLFVKNGKFSMDTVVQKLHYGKIRTNEMYNSLPNGERMLMPSKSLWFFLRPNENVEIIAKKEPQGYKYSILGNDLNKQYLDYRQLAQPDLKKVSELMYQLQEATIKNASDSVINSLRLKDQEAYAFYLKRSTNFIEENPNLEYSAFLLWSKSKNEMLRLFPTLDENVRKSEFGTLLQEKVDAWTQVAVGKKVPNFNCIDLTGKEVSFSDYLGKYVVLDFWGTWCNPCIRDIPEFRNFHKENGKYVEVIGIACRDTKNRVEQAIETHSIAWTQILNDKEQNDLTRKFGIYGFPTKILINPKGVIEEMYVGSENDFFKKMNTLLNTANNEL